MCLDAVSHPTQEHVGLACGFWHCRSLASAGVAYNAWLAIPPVKGISNQVAAQSRACVAGSCAILQADAIGVYVQEAAELKRSRDARWQEDATFVVAFAGAAITRLLVCMPDAIHEGDVLLSERVCLPASEPPPRHASCFGVFTWHDSLARTH
jgi:hypothetical protein